MAGTLAELVPPLVIACTTCKRRGSYRVSRLVQRFGPHASLATVVQALTQSCPHQHRFGARRGNQYASPGCLARVEVGRAEGTALPHATSLSARNGVHFAVDEWLPGREAIAQELAHVTRSALAQEVYRVAVQLDPHAPITLRRGAMVIRKSYDEPPVDLYPGKWEPKP